MYTLDKRVFIIMLFVDFSVATFYKRSTSSKSFLTKCGTENMITACILKCNEYGMESSFVDQTNLCCCVNSDSKETKEAKQPENQDNSDGYLYKETKDEYPNNKAIALISENQPSTSSSTYRYYDIPDFGIPDLAFDGELNQDGEMGFCMHTKYDTPAWLQVDLLEVAVISHVKIFNRNDKRPESVLNSDRLKNATISVVNEKTWSHLEESRICVRFNKITNILQIETFYCSTHIKGRFVRLSMEEGFLHICEMQVYGYYVDICVR